MWCCEIGAFLFLYLHFWPHYLTLRTLCRCFTCSGSTSAASSYLVMKNTRIMNKRSLWRQLNVSPLWAEQRRMKLTYSSTCSASSSYFLHIYRNGTQDGDRGENVSPQDTRIQSCQNISRFWQNTTEQRCLCEHTHVSDDGLLCCSSLNCWNM